MVHENQLRLGFIIISFDSEILFLLPMYVNIEFIMKSIQILCLVFMIGAHKCTHEIGLYKLIYTMTILTICMCISIVITLG